LEPKIPYKKLMRDPDKETIQLPYYRISVLFFTLASSFPLTPKVSDKDFIVSPPYHNQYHSVSDNPVLYCL